MKQKTGFKQQRVLLSVMTVMLICALLSCDQIQQLVTPGGGPSAIKVGMVMELPGQIAGQYGTQLAVAQVNQEGGIFGTPLVLVVRGNDDNPDRSQLAQTRGYKGATSVLNYDANRHPTKSAVIVRIQGGRFRFHQQVEP